MALRLVDLGTDVNCRDSVGGTAMHHAAMANKQDVMFALARLGCDWRARADGIDGATATFVLCGQHGKTTRQQVRRGHGTGASAWRFEYRRGHWRRRSCCRPAFLGCCAASGGLKGRLLASCMSSSSSPLWPRECSGEIAAAAGLPITPHAPLEETLPAACHHRPPTPLLNPRRSSWTPS